MAGVGFALQELTKQDNLLGKGRAWLQALLMTSGPWLLTILAIGSIFLLTQGQERGSIIEFRIILTYNFSLSAVLTAPFAMLATRALADLIFEKEIEKSGSLLVKNLLISQIILFPVGIFFYCFVFNLPTYSIINALFNLHLLGMLWVTSIFLTAVQRFSVATIAFMAGLMITVIGIVFIIPQITTTLALLCFNIGLLIIVGCCLGVVLGDYRLSSDTMRLLPLFRSYWTYVIGAFCYNAGLWVDKWLFWVAPDSAVLEESGLRYHAAYDTAIFFSLFSIIPAIVYFAIHFETRFFRRFHNYMNTLLKKGTYSDIKNAEGKVNRSMMRGMRSIVVIEGSFCVLLILYAPYIFSLPGFDFLHVNIFRIGVVAAFFQVLTLSLAIILSYFDDRYGYLISQLLFVIINLLATLATLSIGFESYGYGVFVGSFCSFLYIALRVAGKMGTLTRSVMFRG